MRRYWRRGVRSSPSLAVDRDRYAAAAAFARARQELSAAEALTDELAAQVQEAYETGYEQGRGDVVDALRREVGG